jgi:uncharacterized Zn-finger protein
MVLLKCPKCKNSMNYQPLDLKINKTKKKRCVYCGKTFIVCENIIKKC